MTLSSIRRKQAGDPPKAWMAGYYDDAITGYSGDVFVTSTLEYLSYLSIHYNHEYKLLWVLARTANGYGNGGIGVQLHKFDVSNGVSASSRPLALQAYGNTTPADFLIGDMSEKENVSQVHYDPVNARVAMVGRESANSDPCVAVYSATNLATEIQVRGYAETAFMDAAGFNSAGDLWVTGDGLRTDWYLLDSPNFTTQNASFQLTGINISVGARMDKANDRLVLFGSHSTSPRKAWVGVVNSAGTAFAWQYEYYEYPDTNDYNFVQDLWWPDGGAYFYFIMNCIDISTSARKCILVKANKSNGAYVAARTITIQSSVSVDAPNIRVSPSGTKLYFLNVNSAAVNPHIFQFSTSANSATLTYEGVVEVDIVNCGDVQVQIECDDQYLYIAALANVDSTTDDDFVGVYAIPHNEVLDTTTLFHSGGTFALTRSDPAYGVATETISAASSSAGGIASATSVTFGDKASVIQPLTVNVGDFNITSDEVT